MASDVAGGNDDLEREVTEIERSFEAALNAASDEQSLRQINARWVGPKGKLTSLMKQLPSLPAEKRKPIGQRVNQLKQGIEAAFDKTLSALRSKEKEHELLSSQVDVTLPGRGCLPGRPHPIMRVRSELLQIFSSLGFEHADGPDIDWHENCFERLGFPEDHPAADMQDSFFMDAQGRKVLRTHTSTVQIREMLKRKPPLAIVSSGAVYRRDDDATHSPMFFQIEGFVVDEGVSFAELKGVLTLAMRRLFADEITLRFRPSYFPFVEPGGEVDIACVFCRAWEKNIARTAACTVCKGTGWLEVLGCGMIHPVVFENVGYDAERWTGFAFGLGLDRIAMLKYGIANIKLLYENDVRFLKSF